MQARNPLSLRRSRVGNGILTLGLIPVILALLVRAAFSEPAPETTQPKPSIVAERTESASAEQVPQESPMADADASLLSVVPEGTEVAKGQIIAELEQAIPHETQRELRLAAARAKSEWEKAVHTLRIRELELNRAIQSAHLELQLLRLDQEHYLEVESVNARESLEQARDFARQRSEQARIQAQWSEELADQGYLTRELLERDRAIALRAESDLSLAEDRIRSFEELTHRLRRIELSRKLHSAETELRLRKESAAEALRRLRAERSEAERRYRSQTTKLDASKPASSASVFRAPRDGVVVYTNFRTPSGLPSPASFTQDSHQLAEARQSFEAVESENAIRLEEAELKLTLARLESDAYTQGIYPQERSKLLGEIGIRREDLRRAEQRLKWSERVIKKGYITKTTLQEDHLSVAEQGEKLKHTQRRLKSLESYVFKRRVAELTAQLTDAEQEVEQHRAEGALRLAQARARVEIAGLSNDSRHEVTHSETAELSENSPESDSQQEIASSPDWPPLRVVGMTEISDAEPNEDPMAQRASSLREGRLRVPIEALVKNGQDSFCFVRTSEGVRKQKVEPGESDAHVVEVKTGVEKGDLVVANPQKMMGGAVYGQ